MRIAFRSILAVLVIAIFSHPDIYSQQPPTVKLSVNAGTVNETSFSLDIKAVIDPKYHIYGIERLEGPVPTSVTLQLPENIRVKGSLISPEGKKHFDEGFGIDVTWHAGTVIFQQPLEIVGPLNAKDTIGIEFQYQACTESYCLPPKTLKSSYNLPASILELSKKIPQVFQKSSLGQAKSEHSQPAIKDTV